MKSFASIVCSIFFSSVCLAQDKVTDLYISATGVATYKTRILSASELAQKDAAVAAGNAEIATALAKEAAWQQAFVSATNLCQRILGLTVKTGAEFKTRAAEIAMTAIIKADAGTISANDLAALNARLFALDILSR